jgi:penicillin-binding protein 2
VSVVPVDLPMSRQDGVAAGLAQLIGRDGAEVQKAIADQRGRNPYEPVKISTKPISRDVALLLAERAELYPGVRIDAESVREYVNGPLYSPIIGYTGPITEDELQAKQDVGYLPTDQIGRTGLEWEYEQYLRGQYGSREIERDASQREIKTLAQTPSQPGGNVVLTIDDRLQNLLANELNAGVNADAFTQAVAIAMNPQTGEILALVSLPTYDNNQFARGISNAAYAKLLNNPDKPLLNHAIQAHYPPGSTYKLVAGTGVLADRKITPSTRIQTRGYLTLGSTRFYDWNHRGFGACNIYCGFGHSSDTFFFQMAGKLGIDRLGYWAKQYGFGKVTGIDLPGEVPGIVPTNQWKQDVLGSKIFPGETYQSGIGQGYDVVTPIQLINAYSALANGGTVYQPQIVRDIVGPDGKVVRPFKPKVLHKMAVPASTLKVMRNAARRTVTLRHTYNLVELPIKVAGKSGTAEFGTRDSKGRLPFHSWFIGFVPKDAAHGSFDRTDAQIVVLAFAYDSRTKGNVATEIVKYFLQMHFGIKKDYRLPNLLKRGNFYQSN